MKILSIFSLAVLLNIFGGFNYSQDLQPVKFKKLNLSGPRMGVTFVPGKNEIYEKLKEKDMGRTLSQFGWHFEYQIVPDGGGPSFLIELVPLVAGVEYGTLIPSATLAFGIRFPQGIEFGMGPNLLISPEVSTALVIAVGKSFNFGGVNIPLNLIMATNPKGIRYTFMFGYAIER
jgi:hypothetical protein